MSQNFTTPFWKQLGLSTAPTTPGFGPSAPALPWEAGDLGFHLADGRAVDLYAHLLLGERLGRYGEKLGEKIRHNHWENVYHWEIFCHKSWESYVWLIVSHGSQMSWLYIMITAYKSQESHSLQQFLSRLFGNSWFSNLFFIGSTSLCWQEFPQ